jgi:hypothetical protein
MEQNLVAISFELVALVRKEVAGLFSPGYRLWVFGLFTLLTWQVPKKIAILLPHNRQTVSVGIHEQKKCSKALLSTNITDRVSIQRAVQ